jgi:hypothetical protein
MLLHYSLSKHEVDGEKDAEKGEGEDDSGRSGVVVLEDVPDNIL